MAVAARGEEHQGKKEEKQEQLAVKPQEQHQRMQQQSKQQQSTSSQQQLHRLHLHLTCASKKTVPLKPNPFQSQLSSSNRQLSSQSQYMYLLYARWAIFS